MAQLPGNLSRLESGCSRILTGPEMSTLRGSKNYVWDTTKPLGQGATSMVYVGREKRTGEEVAVKVFTPQSYQRPRQVQQREFEVMRLLNHENVVRLLAIEEEQTMNGGDVIVMELCPHGSLYNVLDSPENSFGLCEDEFLLVLKQVAAGVKHLRDHDIIHRDIKPGNILRCVAEDGRSIYKLTDFGAARELQENEEFVSLYGTEEYLHPDMYERAVLRHVRGQQFGVHVDLWSLGVTFYHAATGNLPFRPYGGRRNKETMHLITAQKEPGVISGVQLTENGPIEWRKELPSTCRLSLGLRRLITPFLAALLEREPSRTWPFDQFFEQVALITGKMVIDVFCPSSLSPLKIYADQNNVLPQLQELITEQTDIKPAEQLLLCGGQELTSLVQASQPISKYHLDISSTSPIIVYSTSGTLPQSPVTPTIGQFPQMTDKVALDHDYPQAKRCCGVVHTIQDAVKSIADVTVLMNLGVHMFCANLKCQVERQQEAQVHISQQMAIINQWHHMTFTHLQHHLNLLNLTLLSSGPSSIKVSSWLKVIHASQQTARRDCGELLDMLGSSNQQIQTQLPQAEDMLKQVHEWDTCLACTPQDRCAEKIKVMLDRVKKIMSMFKENRNKRHLNFNEDQIHKFEKNKLGELCTRARSLLTDHCIVRRKKLYSAYKLWFEKATQCQTLIIKVNTSLAQMTEYQCQLVNRLKNAEGQWNKLIDDCVEHLKKEIQAAIPPVLLNPVPAGVIQNNGHLNGSGDSLDFANSQLSDHGNGSSASRQERLGSLVDGIHTYRKALEEVEILANENMQRLRYFSLLTEETVSGENGL